MKTGKVKNKTIKIAGVNNKSASSKPSITTPKESKLGLIYQIKTKILKIQKPLKKDRAEKRGRPKTHGLSGSLTYQNFKAAKNRCTNPNFKQFKDYGGRGIEFRFSDVEELVEDIGLRPKGKSLDRIDPNGHYEPGNVRWATPQQQAKNRRPAQRSRDQEFYAERGRQRKLDKQYIAEQEWVDRSHYWKLSIQTFRAV